MRICSYSFDVRWVSPTNWCFASKLHSFLSGLAKKYIAFWGVICYLPPFTGTRNNHWNIYPSYSWAQGEWFSSVTSQVKSIWRPLQKNQCRWSRWGISELNLKKISWQNFQNISYFGKCMKVVSFRLENPSGWGWWPTLVMNEISVIWNVGSGIFHHNKTNPKGIERLGRREHHNCCNMLSFVYR